MPSEDDAVEQHVVVDEGERRVRRVDDDARAGAVEARGERAVPRRLVPELLGGRLPLGDERHAGARAEALVRLEGAEVVERIGHDVAVDPGAEAHAGLAHGAEVRQAVSQVALRGGAHTREGPSLAEEPRLVRLELGRVHGDETARQDAEVGEELRGAFAGLGDALFDLADLLRHVHVEGEAVELRVARERHEDVGGDGAHGMRSEAHTHPRVILVECT